MTETLDFNSLEKEKSWPIEFRSLSDIREFVKAHASRLNFSSVELAGIQLAVNEACSNIMEHGSRGRSDNRIRVAVEVAEGAMRIVIEDRGTAYDPTEHLAPEKMVGAHRRGRGIFLMKKIMDRLEYRAGDGGPNTLLMVKKTSV